MDLTYSEDQLALRDAADKVLRGIADRPGDAWKTIADLGWMGLPQREADGGLGGTAVDVALLCEAFGRHLVSVPYVSRAVLAAGLVSEAGAEPLRGRLLGDLAAGRGAIAVVYEGLALDMDGAETLILIGAEPDGRQRVHAIAVDAPTVTLQTFPTVDGRTAARVSVVYPLEAAIGPSPDMRGIIEAQLDTARACLCADAVGAMQAALDATVAYAKVRVQFGQPIGANQVVKHRLVEMAIKVEEARSLALGAAVRCADGSAPALRGRVVSGAKAKIAELARAVCEDAVQLHGAMGVTEELKIGQYLKRVIAFEASYGTSRWHRQRYASLRETTRDSRESA